MLDVCLRLGWSGVGGEWVVDWYRVWNDRVVLSVRVWILCVDGRYKYLYIVLDRSPAFMRSSASHPACLLAPPKTVNRATIAVGGRSAGSFNYSHKNHYGGLPSRLLIASHFFINCVLSSVAGKGAYNINIKHQ